MDKLFFPMISVMPVDENIMVVVPEVIDENKLVVDVNKNRNNNKKYFKTFIEKNKDEIHKKISCPVCFSTYTYFNKSKHLKTKRHMLLLSMNK